jgi:hypothetical protein
MMTMSNEDSMNYLKEKLTDLYEWIVDGLNMVYAKLKDILKRIWKSIKKLKFWSKKRLKGISVYREGFMRVADHALDDFIDYTAKRLKNGEFNLKEMKAYLKTLESISNEKRVRPVIEKLKSRIDAWEKLPVSP